LEKYEASTVINPIYHPHFLPWKELRKVQLYMTEVHWVAEEGQNPRRRARRTSLGYPEYP